MKHLLLAGKGVTTTRNSFFLGAVALGLSTSSSFASSQAAPLIPSLAFAQTQATPAAPSTTPELQTALRRNLADQDEVRARTAAIVSQVQDLINELSANGISGDDAKILKATKAVLGHLSGPEMDQVMALLKNAAAASNSADVAHKSVDAYIAQKGIILQFRLILNEYEKRQALSELQARFKDLTHRQTDTMRTTVGAARDTMGKNGVELTTTESTTREILQADQEAIMNETNLAGQQLISAAAESADDEAPPLQKAEGDLKDGQVEQILAQANDDLKAGLLMKAIAEQVAARDQLRRIAQDLTPPSDPADAMEQTAADLGRLIEEQKKLLAQTNSIIGAKVMVAGLDDQQGVLVDEATLVQQDTLALNADAADLVKQAINPPMQTSRAQLHDLNGLPLASTSQEEAITKLEEAQKLLDKELTDEREKEKNTEIANSPQPATDPTTMSNTLTSLTSAETNLGNAMTDVTPPGTNPTDTPPSSDTKPATNNPPEGTPSNNNPPGGTPPDPMTMGKALTDLTKAEKNVDDVGNAPGLPDDTEKAVMDAKIEIAKGKIAAGKGDVTGTATHAGLAMTALIKAQTSLSLALGVMPGPPMQGPPGKLPAQHVVPVGNDAGPLHDVADSGGKFIPEQSRDRGAVALSGGEGRPLEYSPLIDQYLKNLSDQATAQ